MLHHYHVHQGLLAAHRGGYLESQQEEEGPAPLLWRSSDFLKWSELCPSEPEIGHALMRLVITGQEIPHACEVNVIILVYKICSLNHCSQRLFTFVLYDFNQNNSIESLSWMNATWK